VAPSTAFRV